VTGGHRRARVFGERVQPVRVCERFTRLELERLRDFNRGDNLARPVQLRVQCTVNERLRNY
jgi:hypothetical protein